MRCPSTTIYISGITTICTVRFSCNIYNPYSTTCFRIVVLYIFNYISSHKIADINPLFHTSLRIFRLRNRHRFAPFCYETLNHKLHIIHYQHIKEAGSVIGANTGQRGFEKKSRLLELFITT